MTIHPWELLAVAGAVAVGLAARFPPARLSSLAGRLPRMRGLDAILPLVALAVGAPPLWAAWARLSAWRSPMGADADVTYTSALAIETGRWWLYERDRYPGYPALVALFSPDASRVHVVGTTLSMVVTVLAIPVAYWAGRALAGRAAGFVAALLLPHVSLVVDIGRTFGPYALVATLDLAIVGGLATLVRGRLYGAAVVAGAAALAAPSDPKQLPVAVLAVALAVVCVWVVGFRRWAASGAATLVLLGAIPLAHEAAGQLPVALFTVEEITTRVHLGMDTSASVTGAGATGYRLGGDLRALLPSLWRLSQGLASRGGWLSERAWYGLPMAFPGLSPWLLLGCILLHRRLVALVPILSLAWSVVHLHYQHRYALAPALGLTVGTVAGVELLTGPAGALTFGAVALFSGPFSATGVETLGPSDPRTDRWVGREPPGWDGPLLWAQANLAPGTFVADYAQSRPLAPLAAGFPYRRCNVDFRVCPDAMAAATGGVAAVLYPGEALSRQLPAGGTALTGSEMPDTLAGCWTKLASFLPPASIYRWTCAGVPRAGPRLPGLPAAP